LAAILASSRLFARNGHLAHFRFTVDAVDVRLVAAAEKESAATFAVLKFDFDFGLHEFLCLFRENEKPRGPLDPTQAKEA
jgi:hypothetical protein